MYIIQLVSSKNETKQYAVIEHYSFILMGKRSLYIGMPKMR